MSPRPAKNHELHGNAPDRSRAVLLIVDMINDLAFPDNEGIVRESLRVAKNIAALKRRLRRAGIPAVYVNDNRGLWRSDFHSVVKHSLRKGSLGRSMVKQLLPGKDDYIVLKPKHSAFHATPLDTLLEYIGAHAIVLAGLSTNACVLLTAGDAYVRDLHLFVPNDCVAAATDKDHHAALEFMEKNFGADTTSSKELDADTINRVADPFTAWSHGRPLAKQATARSHAGISGSSPGNIPGDQKQQQGERRKS